MNNVNHFVIQSDRETRLDIKHCKNLQPRHSDTENRSEAVNIHKSIRETIFNDIFPALLCLRLSKVIEICKLYG